MKARKTLAVTAAAIVVMLDHRRTIRELDLGFRCTWGRWMAIADLAQNLVLGKAKPRLPDPTSIWTALRAPTL